MIALFHNASFLSNLKIAHDQGYPIAGPHKKCFVPAHTIGLELTIFISLSLEGFEMSLFCILCVQA